MAKAVRPYQPVTPANNKYLAKMWDQEAFNTHRTKVATARPVIDNNPPRVHMHLHIKLKKLQFEAERLATIERDNRILLEKMAHIMRKGGVVDNKLKEGHHTKSLNKTKRQRELLRITHENIAILRRLMTKYPHYNHKKWLLQWQVNQQYLRNISKYQHTWRQEQFPYKIQVERQTPANKRVSAKVQQQSSPTKRKSGTPYSELTATSTSLPVTPLPVISTPETPVFEFFDFN
ncbi:sperm axonemal maintenance protein CFAP97D1-like [Mya arenaria]|uniref:sperm axonemal maintenance protein CFAP97D1-like n=1 Tax=Mya arenaria TaxID=6604 RepID=UPI0022E85E94|nr:sperm axonemal maintenance protein CFAP97D1-like [Mya arenaria]XP_052799165.1 sperm axonemal maintenance protein CFAP97D1-like [Mya arenaria]